MGHQRLNTLGASPDNILGQGGTSFNASKNTFSPTGRPHNTGSQTAPGRRSDEELLSLFNEFANSQSSPQAFGDTEAGFRQTLDLRNRELAEQVRNNEASLQQAKAELRSADARHAAELKVRIRELEETLKFNYAELAENERQFNASLEEETRQFDERLGFDQSSLIADRFGTDPLRQAFAALGLDTENLVTAQGNALDFDGEQTGGAESSLARQAADNAALGVNTALGLDPGTVGVSREQGVTGLPSAFKAATATQQGGEAVGGLLKSAFGVGDKISGGLSGDEFTRRIQDVTPRGSLTF